MPGLMRETACGPLEARTISEFSKKYGIPETIAARIIRDRGWHPEPHNENDSDSQTYGEPLEDRLEYMRRRQNKRVGYLAVLVGGAEASGLGAGRVVILRHLIIRSRPGR